MLWRCMAVNEHPFEVDASGVVPAPVDAMSLDQINWCEIVSHAEPNQAAVSRQLFGFAGRVVVQYQVEVCRGRVILAQAMQAGGDFGRPTQRVTAVAALELRGEAGTVAILKQASGLTSW